MRYPQIIILSVVAVVSAMFLSILMAQDKPGSCAVLAQLGQPAPDFKLQDQDGKQVSLAEFANKFVVLEWVNPKCPFVQRHYQAKTFVTLDTKYKDQGVVWLAINSTNDATPATNKAWTQKYALPYPILDDSAGVIGHAYNAKTTPDMFVLDKDHRLVYMGAIDDDPDGNKGDVRLNYVQRALDELLAGKSVSISETKSYGCGVKFAK